MSLTYVTISAAAVQNVTGWGGETVLETSEDTLRWNDGDSKTFVKFDSSHETPSFLEGKTQYTHAQILVELNKPEWTFPRPPG